ncbi:hypothetical protein GCM10027276_16210 [Comamonas piscis]
MNHLLKKYLIAICAFFIFPAMGSACSLVGLQHEVTFDKNEASLGISSAKQLVEWFTDHRDTSPKSAVSIDATYPEGDQKQKTVSLERVKNIAALIQTLNTNNIPVDFTSGSISITSANAIGDVFNEIRVIVEPACTKSGSCCK